MFRNAFSRLPRAHLAAPLAIGGAGGAHFLYLDKAVGPVNCEPKIWDSITGLFKRKAPANHAPLVLVGPSGVGKGTLTQLLFKAYPDVFALSVSSTTRAPRPGEVDGKHYHFVDKETMSKQIEEGKFVEYAHVHSNIYGTSVAALDAVREARKIAILDIDVQGAKNVKEKIAGSQFLFLLPPSMEILEARLRGRGTETEEKVQVRLNNARGEIEHSKTPGFYDIVVVADNNFEKALPAVKAWLEEAYPQLKGLKAA